MYIKRYNKELNVLALYLGDYTKEFYLREISKLTKISLKTTQNIIANLEKNRIIKGKIKGKNKYFKLNLENINTKFYLLEAEIQKTKFFIDKYPLVKTFLKEIKINSPIILFGSFARFKADKDSDMDLLIISKQKLPFHLLPYKLHKIELSESTFKKALETQENLIKEIEDNHIILNNHSFYINQMWGWYSGK